MLDIFQQLADSLFPPLEAVRLLRPVKKEEFARYYEPHTFQNFIALAEYHHPTIKAAITANKFHDYQKAAILLSVLIENYLNTNTQPNTVFVPIPLSSERARERGYNQVSRVLKCAKWNTGE